ncbi:MAG: hypothetical protein DMF87_27880 [Acidobacteria bacterium]|nr:MAG: hypothetical protein DMF87_27880 [Acidobacteriota bacterium]
MVLSLLLDLIVDRLGSKQKAVGKGILFVLDQLGFRQEIMKALSEQIPEAIDPNTYWGKFVDVTLAPKFNEFRDESVGGLNTVFAKIGVPTFQPNEAGEVKLTKSGSEFPEAEAMLTEEPDPLLRYVPVTAPGPGAPMSDPIRTHLERRFGHDFTHVRVHHGEEARSVTGRYHADAITTGSHIFLKPGLDPREGHGARVLRHELGHVLQQTGPRPLGGKHSSHAVLGQPQQGLKYDPGAEAGADRMARAAERGAAKPLRVERADEEGLQPFSLSTVGRVLRRLARGEAMTRHYEKLNQGQGLAPLVATLPNEIQHQIELIATDLYDCFNDASRFKMAAPFNSKWNDISTYVKGRHTKDEWGREVTRVALESLNEVRVPGASSSPDAKPTFKLSIRTFHVSLEGLLYATGIGCSIAWDPASVKTEGAQLRIKSIDLATLNMGEIGGASQLWTELMMNTFGVAKGSDEKNRLQPRVRTYLQARGPVWHLWDSSQFALRDDVKKEILDVIAKSAGETLKREDLPTPPVYLSPAAVGSRPPTGYIGLLIGTYETQTGQNKSVERESHHTTQFLLLEYFRNWHEVLKPFKHTLNIYPGLVAGANGPQEYHSKTRPPIQIAALTGEDINKRGPKMPAISLARVTHRRGDVHIHGEPDDLVDTDPKKKSQAFAVQNHFRSGLGDEALSKAMLDTADETPLRTMVASNREHAQEQIYTAMQETYRWMRDDMHDRLLKGLQSEEVNYYVNLATPPEGGKPVAVITAGEMTAVVERAALNNKNVMEGFGHWS